MQDDDGDNDLGMDVVDDRMEKQIEKLINEDLTKIKKGSFQY